jgi:phage shock protein E
MPTDINRFQVQRMVGDGSQLVEVLPTAEYEQEHLPGAINIPLKQLDHNTTAQHDSAEALANHLKERKVESTLITNSDGVLIGRMRRCA